MSGGLIKTMRWVCVAYVFVYICRKTAVVPFYSNVYGPSLTWHIKQQKLTSRVVGSIRSYYYMRDPRCDEINFCCFVCHSTTGLTRCYETAAFCIHICSFSTQIHGWDQILLVVKLSQERIQHFRLIDYGGILQTSKTAPTSSHYRWRHGEWHRQATTNDAFPWLRERCDVMIGPRHTTATSSQYRPACSVCLSVRLRAFVYPCAC